MITLTKLKDALKASPNIDFFIDRPKTTEKRNLPFIIWEFDLDNQDFSSDNKAQIRSASYILKYVTESHVSPHKNKLVSKLLGLGLNYSILGSFEDPNNSNWITNYQIKLTYSRGELERK